MPAVAASTHMPSRQFSAAIVGASWPVTEPSSFQSASEAQHQKALRLLECAERTRAEADRVRADQSGDLVDGFSGACHRYAATYVEHADQWFAMSRVSAECAFLVDGLRQELDQLDDHAHQAIDQILRTARGPMAALASQQIMAVVTAARAEATAKGAQYASAIGAKGAQIGVPG